MGKFEEMSSLVPYIFYSILYRLCCIKTWLDKNNKLGWTLLPKCASTSMRVIQLVRSGYYTGRENFRNHKAKEMWPVIPLKHHVHKIDQSDFSTDFSDYKFITVIRHPLKRLVSAYSDKIGRGSLRVSRQYFWQNHGREIISRYRKNYPNLTQVHGILSKHERNAIRDGLIPTFPEFIDYVIAEFPRGDAHWLPQIPLNDFCNLPYQYVLKMENLTEELNYLLNELELPKLDLSAIGSIGRHETSSKVSHSELLAQLNETQFNEILKLYKIDFDTFTDIY